MTTVRLLEHNQGDVAFDGGAYDIACRAERGPRAPARMETFTGTPLKRFKGLAIDWDPDVFTVHKMRAHTAHPGIPRRSPRRGTFVLRGEVNGVKVAVIASHRINDRHGANGRAFPKLADRLWRRHAALDARIAKRLVAKGYVVLYGGDINDHDADLLPLFRVRRTLHHYDAIGHWGARLVAFEVGDKGGSDHNAFTATFDIKET